MRGWALTAKKGQDGSKNCILRFARESNQPRRRLSAGGGVVGDAANRQFIKRQCRHALGPTPVLRVEMTDGRVA